jgi:hypothetical protein
VIDQRQAPDFSNVLFNRVGMWPPSFVLQMVNNRYLRPFQRAASRGEEGDEREPASDLEAAAGDVLVRDAVCGEVERGSK